MNHMAVEIKKSLGKLNCVKGSFSTTIITTIIGLVDIVICNAAVLYFAHTMELTADELQRAMNVNIMGILYVRICFMQNLLDSGEQNNCYLM